MHFKANRRKEGKGRKQAVKKNRTQASDQIHVYPKTVAR